MRITLSVIAILILIILQLALQQEGLAPHSSSLVLSYLCVLMLFCRLEEIIWLGLAAGALLDVFSGLPDGVMAISFPVGLALGWYIGQALFTERFSTLLLPFYALVATIASGVVILLVLEVFALLGWIQTPDWLHFISGPVWLAVLGNLVLLIPAYWVYLVQQKIQKRFWPKLESFS